MGLLRANLNQSICQHHQAQESSFPFISSRACLHSLQHQRESKPYRGEWWYHLPLHSAWLRKGISANRTEKEGREKIQKNLLQKKILSQIKPWVWSFSSLDSGFTFTTHMNVYKQFNARILKAQSIQPRFLKSNIITSPRTTEVYWKRSCSIRGLFAPRTFLIWLYCNTAVQETLQP